jgi:hypothetical protein
LGLALTLLFANASFFAAIMRLFSILVTTSSGVPGHGSIAIFKRIKRLINIRILLLLLLVLTLLSAGVGTRRICMIVHIYFDR